MVYARNIALLFGAGLLEPPGSPDRRLFGAPKVEIPRLRSHKVKTMYQGLNQGVVHGHPLVSKEL